MPQAFDITILTDRRYTGSNFENNISTNQDVNRPTFPREIVLFEDEQVAIAFRARGLRVHRTNWDDSDFDWNTTRYALFRSTWDYFDRFNEFSKWLKRVSAATKTINPIETIYWNIDKFYLRDLEQKGVRIPPTLFIERGDSRTLQEILLPESWGEVIIKPAVSGAARHTYSICRKDITSYEEIFHQLIANERMLVQEFQSNIVSRGEVSFVVFGGKFSHAILKTAKAGDFRVQEDFGGTIVDYVPTEKEIAMAENAVSVCDPTPIYARVDVFWDNRDQLSLGEIELIEPELWFRKNKLAAQLCANAICEHIAK